MLEFFLFRACTQPFLKTVVSCWFSGPWASCGFPTMHCLSPPKTEHSPTDVEVSLFHLHGGLTANCAKSAFRTKNHMFYLTFGLITITIAAIFLPHIVPEAHLSLLWEVWKAGINIPLLPLKGGGDLPTVTEAVSGGVGIHMNLQEEQQTKHRHRQISVWRGTIWRGLLHDGQGE